MEFFILATVLVGATSKILNKIGSHKVSIYLILLIQNISGAATSLAALLYTDNTSLTIPESYYPALVINAVLWLLAGILSFQGIRHTQASIRESVTQSRLIFVPLIAVIFLGETVTPLAALGTLAVFLGIVIAVYKKELSFMHPDMRGIGYALGASLLIAVTSSIDKYIVSGVSPLFYAFLLYAAQTVVFLTFLTRVRRNELFSLPMYTDGLFVFCAGLMSGVFYLLQLWLYQNFDLHIAYPFIQLASASALLLAIVFLKEWDRIFFKVLGFGIAAIGAMMVRFAT